MALRKAHNSSISAPQARSHRLSGTYFDTPELHVKAHGMALCVRRAGPVWIETLTAGGDTAAGQHHRLEDGTPEERHRVRFAAKKARYATEFFQSLHSGGRVKHYLKILEALQDALGALNDAAVADRQLREIEGGNPELARDASFARGFPCASTREDVRRLGKLWRQFTATEPP